VTRLVLLFLALLLVALLVTSAPPPMASQKWGVVTVLIEPSMMTATVTK
jgi:hypothetical protein